METYPSKEPLEDHEHEKQETVHLLEDGWFFGNLLDRKAKISRCYSEPSPSSSKLGKTFVSNKSVSKTNGLHRTPSLPASVGRGGEEEDEEGPRMGDLIRQAMPRKLTRAPSLNHSMIKQDVVEPVKIPSLNRLIRRVSLDPSVLLPPKHTSSKITPGSSSSKNYQRGKQEMANRNKGPPRGNFQRSMSMTLTDQEVRGFRDLGFSLDKEDSTPNAVDGLVGLEIKEDINGEVEEDEEGGGGDNRHPSLAEAWNATQWTYSPAPIPKWVDTNGSSKDRKAQIKSWARAVAYSVR